MDAQPCQLEILDTAGQDDFESLRPQWMMDKGNNVCEGREKENKSKSDKG